jgi:hypothetical protein
MIAPFKNPDPIKRIGHPWEGRGIVSFPPKRSAVQSIAVIDQFEFATHGRYAIRDTSGDGKDDTLCNLALWDWSIAMGAEIPHWVNYLGAPMLPRAPGAHELSANATVDWLRKHGSQYGWTQAPEAACRLNALTGAPSCVTWKNPTGKSGHVVIVRPAPTQGPARVAGAGARNFNDGAVSDSFRGVPPAALEWWIHG